MQVRCDRHAPRTVRQALEALPELTPAREEVLLVATELVSNAVRHSACPEGELLTVSACCSEERMRIAVVDPGLSGRQAEIRERPPETGGLGLKVVQELSERWGAERRQEGYRVWAEVPLAA
jgi:two-component sensor histidine kinase